MTVRFNRTKNRPRPRPRLPRNLAPEQTVHYLAFGESASRQRLLTAPSSEDEFEVEDD